MLARVLTVACAVTALVVSLAACGEDRKGSVQESGGSTATTGTPGTETTSTPGGAAVATVKVKETEYELDPQNPKVTKAEVVSFRVENAGKITHALEVEGPGHEVETEAIPPGKSATLKADLSKPGAYEWYCPIDDHKARGMKGTITVAGGVAGTGKGDSGKYGGGSGKSSGDSGKSGGGPGKSGGGSGKSGGGSGESGGVSGGGY